MLCVADHDVGHFVAVRVGAAGAVLYDGDFTEEWKEGELRESKFVFIGRNIDREDLTSKFMACTAVVDLRFVIGTKVYARRRGGNTLSSFDKGTIIKQWDEGNPYRILLDDGTEVWAPVDEDEFVRIQE